MVEDGGVVRRRAADVRVVVVMVPVAVITDGGADPAVT